jgi:hypothetical protein
VVNQVNRFILNTLSFLAGYFFICLYQYLFYICKNKPNTMTEGTDPIAIAHDDLGACINKGLTKREYFAAMAMQGILSGNEINRTGRKMPEYISEYSVNLSDALINALNA